MRKRFGRLVENVGWARVIIAVFLALLFAVAPLVGIRVDTSLSDTLLRVGMNGIMVLAMVPMIQSGCGLNFGLPLGVIAGLVGAVTSMEFNWTGFAGFFMADILPKSLDSGLKMDGLASQRFRRGGQILRQHRILLNDLI